MNSIQISNSATNLFPKKHGHLIKLVYKSSWLDLVKVIVSGVDISH